MRVAVILSGCGVRDGAEIHESVCAIYCLEERGHAVDFYAPDRLQSMVVDHATGESSAEKRSILVESARIARGNIRRLESLNPESYDAVVVPGGFGAVVNLCRQNDNLQKATVETDVETALRRAHEAGNILCFMCIAPVIAAKLFPGVRITLGDMNAVANGMKEVGATVVACKVDEACVDDKYRVISVPAYMRAENIVECMKSAKALVDALEKFHAGLNRG